MKLHTVIISWNGLEQNAGEIARAVAAETDTLTVIYSNPHNSAHSGAGHWHQVPNDWYYGKKFKEALRLNEGDIHLHIQADTSCSNWPGVLRRCRNVFNSQPAMGVWSSEINYTDWPTSALQIRPANSNGLIPVIHTDGIVWAFSRQVLNWLAQLDYQHNNLGWGMDWAAAAYAYCHNLLVVRDTATHIHHPRSTGYNSDEAGKQMRKFLQQLGPQETTMLHLLRCWALANKRTGRFASGPLTDKARNWVKHPNQ